MPKLDYSDNQIENLFKGIYSGVINEYDLPNNLYKATAKNLNSGLSIGFGDVDNDIYQHLRTNIYMFSAAKTFQQVKEMQSFLVDDNKRLDYKTFKDRVKSTYSQYNETYLETEYVTALTSGNNAITDQKANSNKELYTQMRYVAIIDQYTAPQCRILNGTIAPTGSKFWHTHSPPQHFNCRCEKELITKYDDLKSSPNLKEISQEVKELTPKTFQNNSGYTGTVFTKDHPYFHVPKKMIPWAKKNFGLPIPK